MNLRNHILAAIGVGAFVICVLACRPAFSPDGKKVVFPVFDADSKQTTVMLYDRNTKRLERIFTRPFQDDRAYAAAVWTPDGKHVVIATGEGDKAGDKSKGPFMVAVLPVDRKGSTRFLHVPEHVGVISLYHPPPILGKHMFLGGEAAITRLDLESGETKTRTLTQEETSKENEILMIGAGERLYYFRHKEEGAEIGAVDSETLGCQAIFEVRESEAGECNPFALAASKDGSRIAVVVGEKEDQKIRVYRGDVLERTLTVGTTNEPVTLGNLLWSSDEKLIYAAHFKGNEEGRSEFALGEIPLNGKKMRRTVLCTTKDGDSASLSFQIALSPDGKSIAGSTTFTVGEAVAAGDHALYLIDLTRAKRPVTKIPVPTLKSVKASTIVP